MDISKLGQLLYTYTSCKCNLCYPICLCSVVTSRRNYLCLTILTFENFFQVPTEMTFFILFKNNEKFLSFFTIVFTLFPIKLFYVLISLLSLHGSKQGNCNKIHWNLTFFFKEFWLLHRISTYKKVWKKANFLEKKF